MAGYSARLANMDIILNSFVWLTFCALYIRTVKVGDYVKDAPSKARLA